MGQQRDRVLVSASVGRRYATVLAAASRDGAVLTTEPPHRASGATSVPLVVGQLRAFIGAVSEGFTALGGFVPPDATAVEAVDSRGNRISAELGGGAWAAVIVSTDERDFEPLVEFFDRHGQLVHQLDRVPSFEERAAAMRARYAQTPGAMVFWSASGPARSTTDPVGGPAGPHGGGDRGPGGEQQRDGIALVYAERQREHSLTGASKLGGRPDLPAGISWPALQGRSLGFIGQINLAELSAEYRPGPTWTGMLAVFCAIDTESGSAGAEVIEQDGGCSVLCFPHESLASAEWPDDLDPTGRFEEVAVELMPAGIDDGATARRPAHQLFGTPASIQDDILSEIAAIHEDELDQDGNRWTLLFQIDEDPAVGFEWGDAGRLYIAIPQTDLVAGELGRAFCLTQSN